MHALLLEQAEQYVPVRMAQPHQLPQGSALGFREQNGVLLAVQAEGVVQKDLLHLLDVGRQLVHKFAPVLCLGADHPEGKFLPGHGLNVGVHPGGHTAVHIGIGALQHQTDAHGQAPFFSMWMVSALALSR